MFENLQQTEEGYKKIEEQLQDPEIAADPQRFTPLMRQFRSLSPIVTAYRAYCAAIERQKEGRELSESGDEELRALAEEEIAEGKADEERLEAELHRLMLPHDPDDDRNVIVEIRAGAGGDEAALFAASLYRMYSMFADATGWKTELIGFNETGLGGYREISFMINGEGAFSKLKFESGVHRVQRVPETEASGRIHTSTVTVAVLPEADEVEVSIDPGDLKIETIKSSGAGGQHINKTESAIRLIHIPSGIVIECQDERSQYKNRDKAMKLLRTRLRNRAVRERDEKIASQRRSQVGTGDRSERIRTYNFPQGRVTDHRIGLTLHSIENFMNGRIGPMIEALCEADIAEKLRAAAEDSAKAAQ